MSARLDRVLTALCLLLAFGLGPAAAQDLAAAARKAREERAKKHAPAAPTYTEDDLASKRSEAKAAEPEATPGSESEAQPTPEARSEDSTSTPPPSSREDDSKVDSEERERAQQEAYWHKRMQDARSRVERAEARLERATQQAGRTTFYTGRYARRFQAAAQEEVEKAQKELDEARQALEDLPDEARRAGAMPGWLR